MAPLVETGSARELTGNRIFSHDACLSIPNEGGDVRRTILPPAQWCALQDSNLLWAVHDSDK